MMHGTMNVKLSRHVMAHCIQNNEIFLIICRVVHKERARLKIVLALLTQQP